MVPTLQQLGIDTLSPEDRFALAQALWDSCPRLPGRAADCSRGALKWSDGLLWQMPTHLVAFPGNQSGQRHRDVGSTPIDLL